MGASQSKKAFKAALKKHRMEKLSKGQRNSSGVGILPSMKHGSKAGAIDTFSKSSTSTSTKRSPATSYVSSSSNHSPARQTTAKSTESKRSVKATLKAVTGQKHIKSRVGGSNPNSGLSSPATLHGRVLQKTSTVSPAPSYNNSRNNVSTSSLPRFGFKASPLITSGESTDSVNSILSDVQTTSDSNSNIYEFSEENGNLGTNRSSTIPSRKAKLDFLPSSHQSNLDQLDLDNNIENFPVRSREVSPCTISQASSGVTSSVVNGKLKTQTRQLQKPQIVSVKPVVCKNQSNLNIPTFSTNKETNSPEEEESVPQKVIVIQRDVETHINNINPQNKVSVTFTKKKGEVEVKEIKVGLTEIKQSLVMPKVQVSKIPQTKSSLQKSQRVSRDSESSSKSINTQDSGLGSSSESDKSKSGEINEGKKPIKNVSTKVKVLDKEANVELDVSDAWLKEKHSNGSSYKSTGKNKPKDSFKDKRDNTITYGMARQKFAPYNRPRISYPNLTPKVQAPSSNGGSLSKVNSTTQNGKVVSTGIVRSRIAQIEKTPLRSKSPVVVVSDKKIAPKKPFAQPTTIEKTPIVVTPTSESTVELSRPVCRRLEYSEARSSRLETLKDNRIVSNDTKTVSDTKASSPTAQDFLIVASYELKKCNSNQPELVKPSLLKLNSTHSPNSIRSIKSVCLKDKSSDSESDEGKRIKDLVECEKPMKRESETIEEANYRCRPTSKTEDSKSAVECELTEFKLSPNESESSFEVLESPVNDMDRESNESKAYLSKLIVEMTNKNSDSCVCNVKHTQESPVRIVPIKKSRNDSTFIADSDVPPLNKLFINEETSSDKPSVMSTSCSTTKFQVHSGMNTSKSSVDSNAMENSVDTPRMSESCDRSGISGKCTPTLSNSNRCDMDQDFLIDDEISDQPGLTFGDDLDASFLGDELLFPDEVSSSSLLGMKTGHGRSRHESMGTVSNVSGDDLMLDYEADDHATSRGYEEDVLSPVACEIFDEWTAMMAEVQEDANAHTCVSRDHAETDCSSSTAADIHSSAFNISPINSHQPLSNGFSNSTGYRPQTLSSNSCCRPRLYSNSGVDASNEDPKKGMVFKPPRQGGGLSEQDGKVSLDRTSYHYICQDVTAMKTLLFRLRRILQVAETINPFDPNLNANMYMSLGVSDVLGEQEEPTPVLHLDQENVDLKRQVVLLQQRLEEKDRSIRVLQQQLAQALQQHQHQHHCSSTKASANILSTSTDTISSSSSKQQCSLSCDLSCSSDKTEISNAATQTERTSQQRSTTIGLSSISRTTSIEDGLGPTVSSEEMDRPNLATFYNHFDSDFTAGDNLCNKQFVAPPSEVHINITSRNIPSIWGDSGIS